MINPTERNQIENTIGVLRQIQERLTEEQQALSRIPFADYAPNHVELEDRLKFSIEHVGNSKLWLVDLVDALAVKPTDTEFDLYTTPDLSHMTIDELRELKKEWSRLGVETIQRCADIAKQLGRHQGKKHGHYMIWQCGDLKITWDSYVSYTYVHFDKKSVGRYTGHGEYYFVPGAWVKVVDEHYPQVQAKKHTANLDRQEQKRLQLLRELSL